MKIRENIKKLMALMLIVAMMSAVAGCGGDDKKAGNKEQSGGKESANSVVEDVIGQIAAYKYYDHEENDVINPLQLLPYTGEKAQPYPWSFTAYNYKESVVNALKYSESYWTPNRQLYDIANTCHLSIHGISDYGNDVWSETLDKKIEGTSFVGTIRLGCRYSNDDVSMTLCIDDSDFHLFNSKEDLYGLDENGYSHFDGYVVEDEYDLGTISNLMGIDPEDMKVSTFKEAYDSGMWLYMPSFINPTFIEEYIDEDYSNEYRLEIIKDTLSDKGLGIPSYVYIEDLSEEYNTLRDIQRALLVYDTEDSVDYMIQVWYSMEPAISERPNKVYASDLFFWGSGFETEDIVNYMNIVDSTRYFRTDIEDYTDPALTPDINIK